MISTLDGCRIGLLTASASRLGGGVFEAVVAQAAMIRQLGGDARVFALEDAHSQDDLARFPGVPVTTVPVSGPRQIGFAPALVRQLLAARLDCLHLHGIWMYPSAAGATWARRTGNPYFISPHGMLDPWITARGRWKKALARIAYERRGWAAATALHGLTRREAGDIARESARHDTLVIPNAGPGAVSGVRSLLPEPVVAYIGRIHAKKNLLALVRGWSASQRPAGARLEIAGWGDAQDVDLLKAAIAGTDGSVVFHGPLYGEGKADLLTRARFVVLPSHSEGLPMAMLEAWAQAVPTLMTQECNLPEGFAAGAAIDCGHDPASIASALTAALAAPADEWMARSAAALALARGPFCADTVAGQWAQAYAAAIGRAQAGVQA